MLTLAGITIGAVVVPQGMAYAKLANLPVQYGLYSSFMGVLIYWFFATSKDITIGVSKPDWDEFCSVLTSFSLWPSCQLSLEM
jgi:MFS superfamily sulfate permease-like transporter